MQKRIANSSENLREIFRYNDRVIYLSGATIVSFACRTSTRIFARYVIRSKHDINFPVASISCRHPSREKRYRFLRAHPCSTHKSSCAEGASRMNGTGTKVESDCRELAIASNTS